MIGKLKISDLANAGLQLILGILLGYFLFAYIFFKDRPIGIQSDGKTPTLETVVGYEKGEMWQNH